MVNEMSVKFVLFVYNEQNYKGKKKMPRNEFVSLAFMNNWDNVLVCIFYYLIFL